MYQWLDRAPRGRNEAGIWWRRHDEYVQRKCANRTSVRAVCEQEIEFNQ